MALQLQRSDPETGAEFPVAYVRIDDAQVSLATSSAILTLNTYFSAATASARTPLKPVLPSEQFTLTQDELVQLRIAFRGFLYALPRLRALYPQAIDV